MSYVPKRVLIDLDLDVDPLASGRELVWHLTRALRELTAAPHLTIENIRLRRLLVDENDMTEAAQEVLNG